MSVSAVSPTVPIRPPEPIEPKPLQVKADRDDTRAQRPPVVAALPPGQGTRINQLA
jgi:hypothetical protein